MTRKTPSPANDEEVGIGGKQRGVLVTGQDRAYLCQRDAVIDGVDVLKSVVPRPRLGEVRKRVRAYRWLR